MKSHEKLCGIAFDAIYLNESIKYNQASDMMEGTEDLGEFGKADKAANFALVFMVKGIITKCKNILGYFFYNGALRKETLQ